MVDKSKKEIEQELHHAVISGQLNSIKILLQEHDFLKVNQHQDNSVFQMCLRNHAREMVKIFMAEDFSLEKKTGYTQAHKFVEEGNLRSLVDILQVHPHLISVTDGYGNTPLHLAATYGNVEIIKFLHGQGAELSTLNADKNTPLQLALLFDPHPEKNAAKYIANQSCIEKNIDMALSLEQLKPLAEGKYITQEEWHNILDSSYQHYYDHPAPKHYQNQLITVNTLLQEGGYLPVLKNIKIGTQFNMNNVDFSGVSFDHCVFNGTFSHLKFSSGSIVASEFDHAYFHNTNFSDGSYFQNSVFTDTYFQNTQFNHADFNHTLFSHVSFDNTTIAHAHFDKVFISHSNLLGLTLSEPQKFQVVMDNTVFRPEIVQEVSNDIQLLNNDAPVIGLISSHYEIIYGGEVGMTAADPYARLKQYGATPVLLDIDGIAQKINYVDFIEEVKSILISVPEGVNIPKFLLSQHAKNLDKVKAIAQDYAKYLDAAWIPGGPDVHPAFYGKPNMGAYEADYNYVREVFEFALIDQMVSQNKPLMGICHGSQITNVYFGGTLIQHVDGHDQHHFVIPENNSTGVVSQVLIKPTYGVSAHHQAIDKLGEGLQVVAVSGPAIENFVDYPHEGQPEKIIEASEGRDGKPIMLFQFHPEYNVDDTNRDILMQFLNLAKESRQIHAHDIFGTDQLNTTVPIYMPELAQALLNQTDVSSYHTMM